MKIEKSQENKKEKESKLTIIAILLIVAVFAFPLLKQSNISLLEQGSMGFRAEEVKKYTFDELIYLGDLSLKAGEVEKAIDFYTKAIIANPNSSTAYYMRGIAHYNSGNRKQAIQDLHRAYELEPTNSDIRDVLTMVMSGGTP